MSQGLQIVGSYRTKTWRVTASGFYTSAMRERAGIGTPPPALRAEALFTLDTSASYRITSALKIYLNARNLLDERAVVSHRPFGARPNAPRWIQVGIKCEF